jgi:tricorn protease
LPVEGTLNIDLSSGSVPPAKEYLDCFDFGTGKFEYFGTGVTNFKVRHACGLRMVRQGNSLRIFKAVEKAEELGIKDIADSKSGLIDLSRANIMVEPKIEWRQMFRDAWRMQKEFFWSKDLLGIDWDAVYKRYEPLIEKVNCRREFSDVIWELVGELGTSHAYERGGDYRINPAYPLGALGADMVWDEKEKGYEISRIFRGDPWSKDHASPLIAPGIQLKAGDFLTEIAGVSLSKFRSPAEAVLNRSGQDVWIRYRARGESDTKTGIIRLLKNEQPLRYRAWVNEKRARVKELSQERLGYVHIPNMMGLGFAEFHRGFLQEVSCEGLVIDVRYNGGGHVSQLILDRLARRPLGKSVSRWTGSQSVPYETPRKATVAICNEFAGSDGDIFSHTFKMRKIGKLIGTRTWGGVVGIWPRYSMIDGGLTTQPEFSTWFEDLGYGLENHGAEPDLVVEFPPEAWRLGQDPQLEAAVNEALKSL